MASNFYNEQRDDSAHMLAWVNEATGLFQKNAQLLMRAEELVTGWLLKNRDDLNAGQQLLNRNPPSRN